MEIEEKQDSSIQQFIELAERVKEIPKDDLEAHPLLAEVNTKLSHLLSLFHSSN